MNKIKLYLALLMITITSFFLIGDIYCILIDVTPSQVNSLSISQNTSYTVVHELMNLDGTTYTEYLRSNYNNVTIGTTVSPPVFTFEGYNSPAVSTVTLNSFSNTVITYRYTRKQYTLTINNSNYVTTTTPSGTYYYGQPITLVADAVDSNNNPFVKWSNDNTNTSYSFVLTGNVTIGPVYATSYTVTYEPNNGDAQTITTVPANQALGSFPSVTYDDCQPGSGDYLTRQCTYVYEFEGWFKEANFVNQVNESFVPTSDITLYAKWNKIFFHNDQTVFTGNNYLDTEIALFSTENADKDFIVTFTFDALGSGGGSPQLLFTNMHEGVSPYAGVSFKYMKTEGRYDLVANAYAGAGKVTTALNGFGVGDDVVLKRENGRFYYSTDGGTTFTFLNDFNNFNLFFDVHAVFGAGYNGENVNPYRYFKGTLSNMTVELIAPDSYTLHFDANGGSGMMIDQTVKIGQSTTINSNAFTNGEDAFSEWNTAANGSGTSYSNNYLITSDLGNTGDVITLYAQWIHTTHFTVHFDANGGTGTMADQRFTATMSAALTPNAFTRTDYVFAGWNTAANGSGTPYDDEEVVSDLTLIDEDTVTLYAQWTHISHYNVHFDANGGTGTMTDQRFTIGTSGALTPNAFTRTNYEHKGWNTAADGSGTHYDDEQVVSDLSLVDEDTVTLYAEWMRIAFSRSGNILFDGTVNTFIDTGVNVFSNDPNNNDVNINKDFEIRFTFVSVDSDQLTYTPKQPTIFNVKDESNSYMPGFNLRFNATNNTSNMTPTYKWAGNTGASTNLQNVPVSYAPVQFIYKRVDGVITMQYKYNGAESQVFTTINQSSWTLNQPFATDVAFGGYFDGNNNPGRFFKGTLADIVILLDD